jgi:LAGLIDADG endonuclease
MYEFGIELSMRDVQLIYKIKELLSVGTVLFINRHRKLGNKIYSKNISDNIVSDKNTVIYRIRNKSHLKEIIIPIFDKYPFFTNKQYDYIRFKTLLLSNVIYSKELTDYTRPTLPINSIEFILNTFYFSA